MLVPISFEITVGSFLLISLAILPDPSNGTLKPVNSVEMFSWLVIPCTFRGKLISGLPQDKQYVNLLSKVLLQKGQNFMFSASFLAARGLPSSFDPQ